MNDEEMKQLWQNQPLPEASGDIAALVATAQEKHRKFQRSIFWRDFREVAVALVLIPIFVFYARRGDGLWTNYLIVGVLAFIAGFMLLDRQWQRRRAASPGATMVEALAGAVREVEHQIWLLRNIVWWYIGPLLAALMIQDAHRYLRGPRDTGELFESLIFLLLLGAGVWWLNRYAVRRDLEPRRAELQALLDQMQ